MPERAWALAAKEAVFGLKPIGWLATYSRSSRSWRTSQHSLSGDLTEFSATWPRAGLMRGGIVYALRPLVIHMHETVSGLLPTPRHCDGKKGSGQRKNGGGSYGLGHWVARRLGLKQQTTTKFDPSLSELLMGYPIGWTELDRSETP